MDEWDISKTLEEDESKSLFSVIKKYYEEQVTTRNTGFFKNRFDNSDITMRNIAREIMIGDIIFWLNIHVGFSGFKVIL